MSIFWVFLVILELWKGPLGSQICGMVSLGVDDIGWSSRLGLGKNLWPLQHDFYTTQQPEYGSTSPNHNFWNNWARNARLVPYCCKFNFLCRENKNFDFWTIFIGNTCRMSKLVKNSNILQQPPNPCQKKLINSKFAPRNISIECPLAFYT